jgi:hypothetical protein
MNSYKLEKDQFYYHSSAAVGLFKGFSLSRSRFSTVVKRHEFAFIQQKAAKSHAQNIYFAWLKRKYVSQMLAKSMKFNFK